MARSRVPLLTALLLVGIIAPSASAQLAIAPPSPRWGETMAIRADPSVFADQTQRFYPGDRLYAVVYPYQSNQVMGDRVEVALAWDGRRFVGEVAIPVGCEAGFLYLATPERRFETTRVGFLCRKADGSLPPGALIAGLQLGAREKSHWKDDIAQDLAALRHVERHGWEYVPAWWFSWKQASAPLEERVRDVERVDREEGENAGPAVLGSLAFGYYRVGQPRKAFDKFKELCDRFPHSPDVVVGLAGAQGAMLEHPELEAEFSARLAQVARAAPENRVLRRWLDRLVTKTPGVGLDTVRTVAERWIADQPTSVKAHFALATALAGTSDHAREAEEQVSQAIEFSLQPRAFDEEAWLYRQRAYRLRSQLRARRGDLLGAIADARMAQVVAEDKAGADDLSTEAELWGRLGLARKSESLAVQAYALGSLHAEAVLKNAYVARTGAAEGFEDYLIDQLRGSDHPAELLSKPVPAFSATTLEGARIDATSLRGKITVVDFWFTTCPPCRGERPKLNELANEFGGRVRFVGFALDKPEVLKAYLLTTPFQYEIVPESEPIARLFGVVGYPQHLIIGRSGNIVWSAGPGDADRIERLRAMIFRLLARGDDTAKDGKPVSP